MAKNTNLNVKNIEVAVNEVITAFSVNRNIEKLLQNDKILYESYKNIFGSNDIMEYIPFSTSNREYVFGDIVWFLDKSKKLWLLKCIWDSNKMSPELAINDKDVEGVPLFEKYGWQDQNKYITIEQTDIDMYVQQVISTIMAEHENDTQDHEYGKLSNDPTDENYIKNKLMLRDLSNVDPQRKHYLFPSITGHFTDDTILNGTYTVWQNGIIEFDVVYRLGYTGKNTYGKDVLTCNNVRFGNTTASSTKSKDYQQNMKYFMSTEDTKIFMNRDGMEIYEHQDATSVQTNRNKYVNTYFAKLNLFPKPITIGDTQINKFNDLNYMIFGTGNLSQGDYTSKSLSYSSNQMCWCNKTPNSVTALLITYPAGGNQTEEGYIDFAKNGGIFSNSFSCHIIGRWK